MLQINKVTMLYDKENGVRDIDIQINSGEIISFIGPNGAGKTTIVKCIAGLLEPQNGTILLDHCDVLERKSKFSIGYMQDDLRFYGNMTVYEVLHFVCQVKYNQKFQQEVDRFLHDYNLFEQRNQLVKKLSLGMKKKLSIIMALLGNPSLIILDEPTNGLDTFGILALKKHLKSFADTGAIIIVTSHVLDFVEKICKRCVFLVKGRIKEDFEIGNGSLEEKYEEIYSCEESLARPI